MSPEPSAPLVGQSEQSDFLVRGRGDAVHRPTCHHARREGMVRWKWAEQPGSEFRWEDGHPVLETNGGRLTLRVVWLHACQQCRPDIVERSHA